MPTMTARYGHSKSSGPDDRQQLTSIAALIAADPRLKPTMAIRSLGVEDPVVIRRLRSKFRAEEPRLMAQARRARRSNGAARLVVVRNNGSQKIPTKPAQPTAAQHEPQSASSIPEAKPMPLPPWQVASTAAFNAWCDFGFLVARAAVEKQSVVTQQLFELPPVMMALRGQLALNSVAVAIVMRSTRRTRRTSKFH